MRFRSGDLFFGGFRACGLVGGGFYGFREGGWGSGYMAYSLGCRVRV